jgi:hypothetical protein
MPGPLYHLANTTQCVHGGKVTFVPTGPRVFVNGTDPVATASDVFTVVACAFATPAGPHPCVTTTWPVPAMRLTSMGRPLVLLGSVGMTQAADMAPQGPPATAVNQPRVIGT